MGKERGKSYNEVFAGMSSLWKPTRKKVYTVKVRPGRNGEKVHNYLENTDYVVSFDRPYIITGTVGEEWVVTENVLCKKYYITPSILVDLKRGKKVTVKSDAGDDYTNFAMRVDASVSGVIRTSWGDALIFNRAGIPHGAGDFIVCNVGRDGKPDFSDMWVVNGRVFETTYAMYFNMPPVKV